MNLEESKVNHAEDDTPMVVEAQHMLEDADQRVRTVVREHPFLTLFGALLGGYFFGRIIARR